MIAEQSSGFPYLLQFKSEFCNMSSWSEPVTSWSCFCWLYRASPSLATKSIINLISVIDHLWHHQMSSLVLLEEGAMTSTFSWHNFVSLCPASLCTPRLNLPVTPGISWLPTLAFHSPIKKRTFLLVVSSKRSYKSSQHHSASASSVLLVGA